MKHFFKAFWNDQLLISNMVLCRKMQREKKVCFEVFTHHSWGWAIRPISRFIIWQHNNALQVSDRQHAGDSTLHVEAQHRHCATARVIFPSITSVFLQFWELFAQQYSNCWQLLPGKEQKKKKKKSLSVLPSTSRERKYCPRTLQHSAKDICGHNRWETALGSRSYTRFLGIWTAGIIFESLALPRSKSGWWNHTWQQWNKNILLLNGCIYFRGPGGHRRVTL